MPVKPPAMDSVIINNRRFVRDLADALGLQDYRIKSVEIIASQDAFPTAKVEFLIPKKNGPLVAKAVADANLALQV